MTGDEGGGGKKNCHMLITSLLNEGAVIKRGNGWSTDFCLVQFFDTPLGPIFIFISLWS